jgi:hypothetical protein
MKKEKEGGKTKEGECEIATKEIEKLREILKIIEEKKESAEEGGEKKLKK